MEALGNCSLAFHPQQQTIHILKFNLQQQSWFSLSVNSLHIGESRLTIIINALFLGKAFTNQRHFGNFVSKQLIIGVSVAPK